jgi:hypothetical protein
MTFVGTIQTLKQLAHYVGLYGLPSVMKELQDGTYRLTIDNKNKRAKIETKTKNIGRLETILEKTPKGDYAAKTITYINNMGTKFQITP